MSDAARLPPLTDLSRVETRTLHLTWIAFLVCFLAWFAHAPLMAASIAPSLGLSREQQLLAFTASVGVTILARIAVGRACDRFGPRKSYVGLLLFGAGAGAAAARADDWPTYLASRLARGVVGASFVITAVHTSAMVPRHAVGLATATTAGWGNLGGGVAQLVMPLAAGGMVALGTTSDPLERWRPAMLLPAGLMLLVAFLYARFTADRPPDAPAPSKAGSTERFGTVVRDARVWALFVAYAACFGIELFVNARIGSYFQARMGASETVAGALAALFGLMNLFARSLGGWLSDRVARRHGVAARGRWLALALLGEGVALMLFSRLGSLGLAASVLVVFSIFVQMAEGATFALVPFVRRNALGTVSGIVGSGGNVAAVVLAQVLIVSGAALEDCLLVFGGLVVTTAVMLSRQRFDEPERRFTSTAGDLAAPS